MNIFGRIEKRGFAIETIVARGKYLLCWRSLMLLQNESFNPPRYCDTFSMDTWRPYTENLGSEDSRTRGSRPSSEDDVTVFSFLYEQNKTLKEQKMMPCSRNSSMYKSLDRNPSTTSPDLVALESPTHIMKLLSETFSGTPQQDPLELNKKVAPLCGHRTGPLPEDFITPHAESYDKQMFSMDLDFILQPPQPKWTPDSTPETLSYNKPFVEQASPAYSYTNSPSDRYRNEFQFILGAPPAFQHKSSEIPMVYLNKGQFYPITLQGVGAESAAGHSCTKVKTVIMAVFDNDKNPEMQLKCWNHWHARQPTVKQRVIDIGKRGAVSKTVKADYKEVYSSIGNVEEVAFNALSFIWNTAEEAKVYIGINSLSTDFSSQKGVKGLPLNLQIDTYDFSTGNNRLIHRAACQVKVFCDKGAERKMRDEERKRAKRRVKGADSSHSGPANKQSVVSSSIGGDCTYLKSVDDLVAVPVLFIPEMHFSNMQRCGLVGTFQPPSLPGVESHRHPRSWRQGENTEWGKRGASRHPGGVRKVTAVILVSFHMPPWRPTHALTSSVSTAVLLYVRRESEEVFDALMLNSPTLKGLKEAISEKYEMQLESIGKVYKKCKRGIYVNMDNNIIEHYSNHSAFQMDVTEVMGLAQVTLTEL
ncbi:grainyhead-like protein 3-like [Scleropages formosus]|uniref:Grainyhead-like protein 3-like n=1 Tax=Scleropages formosus TaxID=113540 RepID=A0A0P7UF52_SCLFO|nr:grainyhead-like protein 3-like [Scleropages formosus]